MNKTEESFMSSVLFILHPSGGILEQDGDHLMLELRPGCECCDRDLPPDSADARICSFECTFCDGCADGVLAGRCPNCGGELVRRPIRPASALAKYPASAVRVVKPQGCGS